MRADGAALVRGLLHLRLRAERGSRHAPRAGQKLFTLQTVPPRLQGLEGEPNGAARAGGFSLHAGVDIAPHQREKLERLALTSSGHVCYALKTPYRGGTTHIVLEPLDLMARLAALVPPPRMHLTRFHGVFATRSGAGVRRSGRPRIRPRPRRPDMWR